MADVPPEAVSHVLSIKAASATHDGDRVVVLQVTETDGTTNYFPLRPSVARVLAEHLVVEAGFAEAEPKDRRGP